MAKHTVITLGPKDKTVMGDTISEAYNKLLGDIEARTGKPPTDAAKRSIEGNIKPQYDNEKELLKAAYQVYATKVKKDLGVLVECGTLMRAIDKAEFSIELTDHEIDMFKGALPQMENIDHWAVYVDLLEQLNNPKYKEDAKLVTSKE